LCFFYSIGCSSRLLSSHCISSLVLFFFSPWCSIFLTLMWSSPHDGLLLSFRCYIILFMLVHVLPALIHCSFRMLVSCSSHMLICYSFYTMVVLLYLHWYVVLLIVIHCSSQISMSFFFHNVIVLFVLVLRIPLWKCLGFATHLMLMLCTAFFFIVVLHLFKVLIGPTFVIILFVLMLLFFSHWCYSCSLG
jgi:hypothetical protein